MAGAKIIVLASMALVITPAAMAQDSKPGPRRTPDPSASQPQKDAAPAATPLGGLMSWFGNSDGRKSARANEVTPPTHFYPPAKRGDIPVDGTGERCSGTLLCDLVMGSTRKADEAAAIAAQREAERPRGPDPLLEADSRPACSAPSADPWHCYR